MPVKNIFYDPGSQLVGEHFALIYAPQRKRKRFPENCVQIMASKEAACSGADAARKPVPLPRARPFALVGRLQALLPAGLAGMSGMT